MGIHSPLLDAIRQDAGWERAGGCEDLWKAPEKILLKCMILGTFKLDHLQPFKLILFHKFSISLTFILGGPISYYPRERKEGRSRGWKWGKGNETQGFLTLGHSNWTICSLLSWFCSKNVQPFWLSYWEVQFLINPERGRKEEAGAENEEKGITQKWMRHKGFWPWGIQIGPFAACICSLILFQNFSTCLTFILGGPISYYHREREKGRSRGWKWRKGIIQKWMRHRGCWPWGIQIGPFAAC